MPTYEFLHDIEDCKHEWELELSIKAPDPTHCPKCEAKGNITRLISGGSGKGVVEYTGHELADKMKGEIAQMKKDMYKNENTYANMLGEGVYENMQRGIDRRKRGY